MEVIAGNLDGGEFYVSDPHALFALGRIDFSAHRQSLADRGCSDQVYDDFVAHQGLTAPIQADIRKQSMLDLVPLARAWWEVAHRMVRSSPSASRCNSIPTSPTSRSSTRAADRPLTERGIRSIPPSSPQDYPSTPPLYLRRIALLHFRGLYT